MPLLPNPGLLRAYKPQGGNHGRDIGSSLILVIAGVAALLAASPALVKAIQVEASILTSVQQRIQ